MSASSSEIYPGCEYTLSQHLNAAKRKLNDPAFRRRIIATANRAEVKSLRRDELEVLALVRSLENLFMPINLIPPVILLLIPEYFHEDDMDEGLLMLTHVCRVWREIFIFRSSLWTKLSCMDLDKTCTFIQHLKSSPLEFHLEDTEHSPFNVRMFSMVISHLQKLKSLMISAGVGSGVFKYFCYHALLLKELDIEATGPHESSFDNELSNGDRLLSVHPHMTSPNYVLLGRPSHVSFMIATS